MMSGASRASRERWTCRRARWTPGESPCIAAAGSARRDSSCTLSAGCALAGKLLWRWTRSTPSRGPCRGPATTRRRRRWKRCARGSWPRCPNRSHMALRRRGVGGRAGARGRRLRARAAHSHRGAVSAPARFSPHWRIASTGMRMPKVMGLLRCGDVVPGVQPTGTSTATTRTSTTRTTGTTSALVVLILLVVLEVPLR